MLSVVTIALASTTTVLAAEDPTAPAPGQTAVAPPRPPPKYAIGLRGGISPITGIGAFMLGFAAAYSPVPLFSAGLEYEMMGVDNGADSGYCIGCMRSGMSWRAFGEIRPFAESYPVFPFVRASAGVSLMEIISRPTIVSRLAPAFGAAVGVEGRLRPIYLRLFGFATAQLGSESPAHSTNHLAGAGVELGAVF